MDQRFSMKKDEAFGDNRYNIKKDASVKDHQQDLQPYQMPDGQILKVGQEKKIAPEILFKPELIGLEYPGVHDMVINCI